MKTFGAIVVVLLLVTAGCGYHDHYRHSDFRRSREEFRRAGWEAREELRRARQNLQREMRQAREDFRREMRQAHSDVRHEFDRW